ncbi:hypothetical protein ACTNEF_01465 [Bariatricus sp. HCP28S3_E4]|uniref:hypothetical protein n=1 Tax=unclassified Bariatricus TaxID=2677046 RepID=UPI003F8A0A79
MNMSSNKKIPMDNPWEWEALFQCGDSYLHVEHDRTDGWLYTLYVQTDGQYAAADGGYIAGRIYENIDSIATTAADMLGLDADRLIRSSLTLSDLFYFDPRTS